ncbi:LpqB family beta-propeller domain-containing protein [Microbacterium sp. Marseille-Q6965]|uniref:LpqB family beta-propeller domain-containing protein n=1 Tax=Microbacterium sp. Marseille-Q6965 TaxID=2965072 RepID=UPI0021B6F9A5|nr:LpqB family beta-propeller domain-containing protein [Microbacterium sp. Marseille-Q6965]
MRRRGRIAAALLALAVALAGCAGLPTSGPVNPGLSADEVPEHDFLYYPEGPAPGSTPEQIVQGFVEAATSPAGDWATAREFLTSDFAAQWQPGSHVAIDATSAREYDASALETEGVVSLRIGQIAAVDARGVYGTATQPEQELRYQVAQGDDGEWRIAQAPQGIVLDRDYFANVYSDFTLTFYDPAHRYLVPDVRWFPEASTGPTRLVAELLRGPSAALQGAASTAFPSGAQLASGAVIAIDDSGVADIPLRGIASDVDAFVVSRMRAQITATLASVGAQGVRLRVGAAELSAEEYDPWPTRPDPRALVLGGEEDEPAFGFLTDGEILAIDGLSEAVTSSAVPEPEAISVAPDRESAIVWGASGAVVRVGSDGTALLLDDRDDLIEPTLDPDGYTWTLPGNQPDQLTATGPDGTVVLTTQMPRTEEMSIATVESIAVSRDGTRLAALVTAAGGTSWAIVAPVSRDGDGVPTGVGAASVLAALDGPGVDVEWLDDASIGVVSRDGMEIEVLEQRIGGPGTRMSAPADVVGIAAGTQDSSIRLIDSVGGLHVRRGSAWVKAAEGIAVLATDVGAPRSE